MHSIFSKELDDLVIVYFYDVLILQDQAGAPTSPTVFERGREHQMYLNPTECKVATQRATYLEFAIEPGKVSPDPREVEATQARSEILKDRRQPRGFLGMIGFYRKLTPNSKKLADSLHQILNHGSDMGWRPAHTRATHGLERSIVNGH